MFTSYSNQFGFTPFTNSYCGPFNQFGGYNYGFTPATPWFTPTTNWQGAQWFTMPQSQAPAYGFNGLNNWTNWTNGFAPNFQFNGFGCTPEFAYGNYWATPSFNGAPVNGVGSQWQGYTPSNQYGFNGVYAPASNPWNYAPTGTSWNGMTNGQPVGVGYPTQSGACRTAA